jgi:succinate dehydrogenase subunit C
MTPAASEPKSVHYTEYHPRWYRERTSVYWWLRDWRSLMFILREISSVFVAVAVLGVLLQLVSLRRGPESYARFQHWLQSPLGIIVTVIVFLFVVYHSITWFNLAPRAMTVRLGSKKVPELFIAAGNYGMWLVATAFIAWFLLR